LLPQNSDLRDAIAPAAHTLEQEVAAAYSAHTDGLFHYAVSFVHQADDARDALQEVFLRYFAERNLGGRIDNPRAWLYRVLRNYLLDWLDTAARKHEVPGSDTDRFPHGGSDPEVLIYQVQVAAQIRSLLSNRELNCLLLRAEGLSYLEIADVLNLRMGSVGAYLARVQKKLQGAAQQDRKFYTDAGQALAFLCHEAKAY
jgi:RNA polymerase sigma-70 factor (ECF subfamily)